MPVTRVGMDAMPFLDWHSDDNSLNANLMKAFCSKMIDRGVLVHPSHHWFTSCAMSSRDEQQIYNAMQATFQDLSIEFKI